MDARMRLFVNATVPSAQPLAAAAKLPVEDNVSKTTGVSR